MDSNIKEKTKLALYWNFFTNIANQGMGFVIGILLARLLSPSDYGIIALPAVFLAIAQCFIDSGFSAALVRKPDLKEEDLSTAFYFNICVGVFFYICLFFSSPYIADFYNVPLLKDLLRVTALSTLFGPLRSVHFAKFSRNLDFKTPAKISIYSQITTGIVGVAFAYMGYGVWALVIQGVAGQLLGLALVWFMSPWRPRTGWSSESFKYLWGFGSKMLASGLLDVVYGNLNQIVIGKFFSTAQLGEYNRADDYARLPYGQISGMLEGVSYPVLSKLHDNPVQQDEYFRKMLRMILFILAPVMMMLAALARPLIIVMITEKWEACIYLLQIICFAVMLWPIQSLNLTLFKVKGQSGTLLKANTGIKILGFAIKIVTLPIGVVAICYGALLHSVLAISWVAWYAGKYTKFGVIEQFKQILPGFSLSFIMFCLVLFVNSFIPSYYLQIIIGGIVGASFYLGSAYLLKLRELDDAFYLLHIKK